MKNKIDNTTIFKAPDGRSYLVPFILVTSLFLLWGFAHGLLDVLNKLVDKGNTVIVIEHNLDVVKVSDYLIDIGQEGGSGGGRLIATGTPEQVASVKKSYTGQFLKPLLKR